MRLPKYGFSSRVGRITAEVRTAELNKVEGDSITLESLRKAGVITANIKRVKIMLSGEVSKKVTVEGLGVTKGAREAIEKAGGKVVEVADTEAAKPSKKAKAAPKKEEKVEAKVEEAPAEEVVEETKADDAADAEE